MQDLVTVIMGAYNTAPLVGAALASIREQTYENLRVIVVNAGSTDHTGHVLDVCAHDDDRIDVVHSPVRLSCPEARNAALPQVTTALVATLDSDDLMAPHRLAQQVAFMSANPRAGVVGGWLDNVTQDGLPSGAGADRTGRPQTPTQVAYSLPFLCPFFASAATFRTDILRQVGGFDESSEFADDYPTIWRVSQVADVWTLPETVGQRRHHAGQISSRRQHSQMLEVAVMRRSFAAAIMGTNPRLSSILLWSGRQTTADEDVRASAIDDLVAFNSAFFTSRDVSEADRAWIEHFFEGRLAKLEGLSA